MRHPTARRLALAALAAAPLLLAGCAAVNELAKSVFKRPTLVFQGVAVESIDFNGATLAFDFRLRNPNDYGLKLARVQYWLQLEGRVVTRGELPGGLKVPASGQAPVRFTTRLPFAEVPHLIEVARRGGDVPYTVGGLVGVQTPVGVIELPLEHAGSVSVPHLPAFRIGSATVRLASLTDVEATVTLLVSNQNAFPLPAGELRYALAFGGEVLASTDAEELTPVPARGEGKLVIPVRLSLLGAGKALGAVVRGGSTDVRLSGEAKLGAMPVPVDVLGKAIGR